MVHFSIIITPIDPPRGSLFVHQMARFSIDKHNTLNLALEKAGSLKFEFGIGQDCCLIMARLTCRKNSNSFSNGKISNTFGVPLIIP